MLILSALMGFASVSTDIYLPALPELGQALHAQQASVALTISGYLVGFGVGQFFWGPVGDRVGRRAPIAAGLGLFILGSVACALTDNIHAMIAWRVLQAAGACAGVVLARAIVRDLFMGERAAQMMSTLMTIMAVAPLVGPTVGGQLLRLGSWRSIFWLMAGVGLVTLAALLLLPETLPPERRVRTPLSHAFRDYGELLRHSRIVGYAGAGGLYYGGVYAYVAGTPFAYIEYYHIAPQHYGWLFACGSLGMMMTNLANARLVRRFGSDQLMRIGTWAAALGGVVAWLNVAMGWGGLVGLVLPLLVYMSALGLVVPNSIAGGLNAFPEKAGAVSALIGGVHYGSGIFGSALVDLWADGTPVPLGEVMALCGVCSVVCTWWLVPRLARGALPVPHAAKHG